MGQRRPANRPKENRVPSTFLPGASAANSAKESEIEVHTELTAADAALPLDVVSPRAPELYRRNSHGVGPWRRRWTHHVIAPYRDCTSYSRVLS